jgi:XTP/dITP diphosphohydrolase
VRLLLATTNQGKVSELKEMVGDRWNVVSLKAYPDLPEVWEVGATFEENARMKAWAYAAVTGLPALADDSGLCVDALDGGPGIHSARYAPGADAARVRKLLAELDAVPPGGRGASFRCALCLALPSAPVAVVHGECRGSIARQPRGRNGFGYDPVFLVGNGDQTMAELSADEKARVSHRGKAFRLIKSHLDALAAGESTCRSP